MSKPETDVEVLLHAINDVQETIRAFDLKAEILAAVQTLAIGMVAFAWHDGQATAYKCLYVTVIITASGAMACLMGVLFPKRNPTGAVKNGTYTPVGAYFITGDTLDKVSVSDMVAKIGSITWTEELTWELMKLSSIRERKHGWFMAAISAATISSIVLFALCIVRYI